MPLPTRRRSAGKSSVTVAVTLPVVAELNAAERRMDGDRDGRRGLEPHVEFQVVREIASNAHRDAGDRVQCVAKSIQGLRGRAGRAQLRKQAVQLGPRAVLRPQLGAQQGDAPAQQAGVRQPVAPGTQSLVVAAADGRADRLDQLRVMVRRSRGAELPSSRTEVPGSALRAAGPAPASMTRHEQTPLPGRMRFRQRDLPDNMLGAWTRVGHENCRRFRSCPTGNRQKHEFINRSFRPQRQARLQDTRTQKGDAPFFSEKRCVPLSVTESPADGVVLPACRGSRRRG